MKKDTLFIKQEVLIKNIQNMTTETKGESKKVIMKAGRRYKLCTCGESKILPFCDDSHRECNKEKNTKYKSVKLWSEKDTDLYVYSSNWDDEEE